MLGLCPPPDSSDSELELSTVRHQPEGLDQLQALTKFTKKELQSLYRGFKNVSAPVSPVPIRVSREPDLPSCLLPGKWGLCGPHILWESYWGDQHGYWESHHDLL